MTSAFRGRSNTTRNAIGSFPNTVTPATAIGGDCAHVEKGTAWNGKKQKSGTPPTHIPLHHFLVAPACHANFDRFMKHANAHLFEQFERDNDEYSALFYLLFCYIFSNEVRATHIVRCTM